MNQITIEIQEDIERIEIYSTDLKRLLQTSDSVVDIRSLRTGLYIVRVLDSAGIEGYKRFCKI